MSAYDRHVRRGHPIVTGIIIAFAIIEGGISTWLIVQYNRHGGYLSNAIRDRTGLTVFTSWWTVFFGLIYMVLFLHSAATGSIMTSVASHAAWLFITWVLWTACAASITAGLGGGVNCSNIGYYLPYCNHLVAMEAFAWIEFILVTFALIIVFVSARRAVLRGDGWHGQLIYA
ncbi:hypothetical protein DACRYDRAFT_23615 [Dacryopinax primogenitus]|uniref:MARVEL domain-containing protein n=1 Tax=Dacryopinax primogenitus (strain DJM 731) TaxID=1858805 RepID=M5FS51_DACPD|nr:uncharacterized protein DACRYDRAFT_23615 [Dacryopinax primogenitus]EJU00151.1 hypothetical protein DACRYDRAFT_23615 [Dacryopinax primogenitus]